MNFVRARIDECDCRGCIVRKCESVLARPGSAGRSTVVLRRQYLIVAAERLGQGVPFAGTCTRTMQGYHGQAVCRPLRMHRTAFHCHAF
jgi:hypothetical protein